MTGARCVVKMMNRMPRTMLCVRAARGCVGLPIDVNLPCIFAICTRKWKQATIG